MVVEEGERLALIGPNGSGKSTLLRIMCQLEELDGGDIQSKNHLRTVFVPQEDRFNEKLTVAETLTEALIAAGYGEYEIQGMINSALGRSGFSDPSATVSTLSGGWRKRLAIIRGLIQEPELLLLDEPTNHLDINGILWLEALLARASFAIVFVSHDRYFIEQLASRVVEIDRKYPQGYFSAKGNYGDFLEARELFVQSLHQARDSLANKVRREVEWLRQGAKARTTKSKHRIAEAGRLSEELDGFKLNSRQVSLEFSASNRKTKDLIKVENVTKAFGDRVLFKDISLLLSPGKRLGIVGANGSGKSTFLRVLLGDLKPDRGSVRLASNLKLSFFDQARQQLDRSLTLRRALCGDNNDGVVFNGKALHVAAWAARFLFSHDQLSLPVGSLSGGEQARVLLAKLMLIDSDVLIFDEPTNDLDISTLEVLEESFNEYPGAIVLVTHDRYLLDRTATAVLGMAPAGGMLFSDYLQWEAWHREQMDSAVGRNLAELNSVGKESRRVDSKTKKELNAIEAKIVKAEKLIAELEAEVGSEAVINNPVLLREKCEQVASARTKIDELYEQWSVLAEGGD